MISPDSSITTDTDSEAEAATNNEKQRRSERSGVDTGRGCV